MAGLKILPLDFHFFILPFLIDSYILSLHCFVFFVPFLSLLRGSPENGPDQGFELTTPALLFSSSVKQQVLVTPA